NPRTPRAISGLTQRVMSAVQIPSRPKGVLNHGTPAYGYGPWAVRVTVMWRSAIERSSQSLKAEFDVTIVESRARLEARSPCRLSSASGKVSGPSAARSLISQEYVVTSVQGSCGAKGSEKTDSEPDCDAGALEKTTRITRRRSSSPS